MAEPTIFRMAAASLLLVYCAHRREFDRRGCLALGVLTGLAWLPVYPTNVYLALFGLLVAACSPGESRLRRVLYYGFGLAGVGIAYLLAFDAATACLVVKEMMADRIAGGANTLSFQVLLKANVLTLERANFLAFQRMFVDLVPAALALVLAIVSFRRRLLERSDYLVLAALGTFALQTLIINDYPERKLVAMVPLLLYLCALPAMILLHRMRAMPRVALGSLLTGATLLSLVHPSHAVVYASPQYTYRDAMIGLKDLGSAHVPGGWDPRSVSTTTTGPT